MNFQQTHPNLKAFLFFILVLICGLFSMVLALYFEKILPSNNENIIIDSYPTESLRASMIDFTHREQANLNEKSSLSGSLVPQTTASISLISLINEDMVTIEVNENGNFLIEEINPGEYEMIIIPSTKSGLTTKTVDVLSIQAGISKEIGVIELQE